MLVLHNCKEKEGYFIVDKEVGRKCLQCLLVVCKVTLSSFIWMHSTYHSFMVMLSGYGCFLYSLQMALIPNRWFGDGRCL